MMISYDMRIFSVTLFFLAILYLFLSQKVIHLRQKNKIAIGHDHTAEFENTVRSHANFSEYVPFVLLELFVLTQMDVNVILLSILCAMILFGRVFHAASLNYFELKKPPTYLARLIGMILTFTSLFASALSIIMYTFIFS